MGTKQRLQDRKPRAPRPPRAGQRIYQCLRCGARTNPIYGCGEDSWCPSCGHVGDICYDDGRLPYPALYGSWFDKQKQKSLADSTAVPKQESATSCNSSESTSPTVSLTLRGSDMKVPQYHNGIYHCPACCLEFDLYGEPALKCDQCGGQLAKGPLDVEEDDEDDNE